MLGISTSLESLTRVVSPTIGGFLFGSVGMWAPGAFSAMIILWATWLAYQRIILVKPVAEQATTEEVCCA